MLTINVPVWLVVFAMGFVTGVSLLLALGMWLSRRRRRTYTLTQIHDAFARWCSLGEEFELYTDEWWEVFETQLMGRNDG